MDGENVLDPLMHECFGNIINRLDEIEEYEKELSEGSNGLLGSGSNEINTIPYGKPSGCHRMLVVIIDGKVDIDLVLNRALKHVGINCKGITKHVLFYIANDYVKWDELWSLYKPSFDSLIGKYGVVHFVYYKFKVELREVKKKLSNFKYEEKPSNEVSEALVLAESLEYRCHYKNISMILYRITFTNSFSYCRFAFRIIPVSRSADNTVFLRKIKDDILLKHKVDLVIGLNEVFLPELTYSQIVSSETELENYIKFCGKKYEDIKKCVKEVYSKRKGRM